MRARLAWLASIVAATAAIAACAQILGYSDLSDRPSPTPDATTDADATSVETASDAGVDTAPVHIEPPDRPDGDAAPNTTGKTAWFVVKRFYLGSQTHDGAVSNTAWREWGFDIDGVCTGAEESNENIGTCLRAPGATTDVLVDGDGCRDNNFGSQIVAVVRTVSDPDFEAKTDTNILGGASTWVVRIDDLDDGADDTYAPGKLYRVVSAPSKPKFDGSDTRVATTDSIVGGNVDQAVTEFPAGYLRGNTWVSGDPSKFGIAVPVGGVGVVIPLVGASLVLDLDSAHTVATDGVLSGAIPLSELESVLAPIAANSGVCPGSPLYDSFVKTLQKFPDLVAATPTVQDTTAQCDAVSIGLGFDFAPVQPIVTSADETPAASKCDAGVDSGP